jgi:hypothetical protein
MVVAVSNTAWLCSGRVTGESLDDAPVAGASPRGV